MREDLVARSTLATRWTDADLRALSARFGVSAEAMLLRLVTLGKATREYYRERRPRFLAVYAQRRGQGSGHGHYYRDKVRYLGRRYIKTLLQAFDNEDLSLAELSTYLDVKYKDVPKLRDWLRRNE